MNCFEMRKVFTRSTIKLVTASKQNVVRDYTSAMNTISVSDTVLLVGTNVTGSTTV